jgi:hypothetical protein
MNFASFMLLASLLALPMLPSSSRSSLNELMTFVAANEVRPQISQVRPGAAINGILNRHSNANAGPSSSIAGPSNAAHRAPTLQTESSSFNLDDISKEQLRLQKEVYERYYEGRSFYEYSNPLVGIQRYKELPSTAGLYTIENPLDGNCLYNSVVQGLDSIGTLYCFLLITRHLSWKFC